MAVVSIRRPARLARHVATRAHSRAERAEMLCLALLVFSFSSGAAGDTNSSSEAPMLLVPPPAQSRRAADELVASLRRQLMRDNYDYQNPPEPRSPASKFYYQKSGTKNLPQMPRTSEHGQGNSKVFGADRRHDLQPADLQQRYAPQQRYERGQQHEPPLGDDSQRSEEPQPHMQPPPDYRDVRAVATPDRRGDGYDPSFYNKRRDTNDPPYPPEQMQVAPVSAAKRRPHREPGHSADTPDEPGDETASDSAAPDNSEQEAADMRDDEDQRQASGTEHDASDSSANQRREQAMYEEYGAQGVRPQVTRGPSTGAREHVVSKQDLLYYMDDAQLRRHNHAGNQTDAPAAARTARAPRSLLVTVAAGNVTYKLLTMKSGEGRRAGARRFLEERAPDSVALISLDRAPLPAFRLPRARRQYMHEPHRRA